MESAVSVMSLVPGGSCGGLRHLNTDNGQLQKAVTINRIMASIFLRLGGRGQIHLY